MSDRQHLPRPAPEVTEDGIPSTEEILDMGLEDTLSAEEAAMQVVDEPPGMNDDRNPGYVDDEREAQS